MRNELVIQNGTNYSELLEISKTYVMHLVATVTAALRQLRVSF